MIGNGLLAFAILVVVALFLYISMRNQPGKDDADRYFTELYTISLVSGFANDSLSIFINDSLLVNKQITEEPFVFEVPRFAEQSTLMIVDNMTDQLSVFDLSERGGKLSFSKDKDGIKQLAN